MPPTKHEKLVTQKKATINTMKKLFENITGHDKSTIDDITRRKLFSQKEVILKKNITLKKYDEQIMELLTTETEIDEFINESTEFELLLEETLIILEELTVKPDDSRSVSAESSRSDVRLRAAVKLPRIEIVKFAGEFTKWQTFIDSFTAAVDSSETLSNVEKFTYLRGYLEEDALRTIQGLSLTENNYDKAMALLKDRFGNTQVIITAHMNELLKLRKIESDKDLHALRRLYDNIENNVRSLNSLGIHGENYGSLLAPIIMDRLPHEFRLSVSRNIRDELWDLSKLLRLINDEIKAREACFAPNTSQDGKNLSFDPPLFSGASLYSGQKSSQHQILCVFCKQPHWSDKCPVITDCEARKTYLRKGGRCFLCLKTNHKIQDCDKKKLRACFYCKRLHNSAICPQRSGGSPKNNQDTPQSQTLNCNVHESSPKIKANVFLQTADVIVENPLNSKQVKVKVLFDSGSQRTYVSDRIKNFLNITPERSENVNISTFGNTNSDIKTVDIVKLNLLTQSNEKLTVHAMSYPYICAPLKHQPLDLVKNAFENFKNINFADSGVGDEIDLLIGSDYYWGLVSGRVVEASKGIGLVAMETRLGWVVSGPFEGTNSQSVSVVHNLRVNCENNLDTQLKTFWELETIGIKNIEKSSSDEFFETITRRDDNRYEISLPFKENNPIIHDNYENSKARLLKLHSKLKQDPTLMKSYNDIFNEQKSMEIIESAPGPGKIGETYYMPHHPVIRNDKSSSKVRIVFDASSKSVGPSLNDCLYKGPQLTPLLFDILLRFRSKIVALTTDIEKAFLQISVTDSDRDYLRFLWFDNIFDEQPTIVRNRFARMVFGVSSSPFGLNGTIREHSKLYEFDTEFYDSVMQSFFVDDFVGGESNIDRAIELFKKLRLRFIEGSFYLQKWRTNNIELRQLINELTDTCFEARGEKILGVPWDENKDVFKYDFSELLTLAKTLKPSKRNVLRVLASFYDPIGMIQPILCRLKILMQNIHKQKLGWDEELTCELKEVWDRSLLEIEEMGCVEVDRYFGIVDSESLVVRRELHGFSDASAEGYGTCVYVRSIYESGEISVKLLASKSRVAPLKTETIPRLELLGNLLLSRLITAVKNALNKCVKFDQVYLWTDSKVTLAWIKSPTKEYKTFVENRLKEIRKNTDMNNWFYCPTSENPADLMTRMKSTKQLIQNQLWWEGPTFLKQKSFSTNQNNDYVDSEKSNIELKAHVLVNSSIESSDINKVLHIEQWGDYNKLLRVTAWVYRFIENARSQAKSKNKQTSKILQTEELKYAEQLLIKANQFNIVNEFNRKNPPGFAHKA